MHALLYTTVLVAFLMNYSVVQAADIKARNISYDYDDVARPVEGDGYAVCDECPDDRMVKAKTPLTISFSRPNATLQVVPRVMSPVPAAAASTKIVCDAKAASANNRPRLIETINFNLDSSFVTPQERRKIASAAQLLKGAPVRVAGFTCNLGAPYHNSKLSMRRAESVVRLLNHEGINVRVVEGKGDCCPVSEDKAMNRRAEILITD